MVVLGRRTDDGAVVLGRGEEKERWRRSCARKREPERVMVVGLS